uniref:G-protein coupled receptors family 1 profile domain-containing protein n=1 Tax=Romanomermis culicivorax TaxID=13658 RepID=A0A915HJA6_ROMCU
MDCILFNIVSEKSRGGILKKKKMSNITNDSFDLFMTKRSPDRSIIAVIYVIIFGTCSFTGTLGNLLVIITLVIEKSLRKSQNLFIGSLASADLIVSSLTMPASITGAGWGIGICLGLGLRGRILFHRKIQWETIY